MRSPRPGACHRLPKEIKLGKTLLSPGQPRPRCRPPTGFPIADICPAGRCALWEPPTIVQGP